MENPTETAKYLVKLVDQGRQDEVDDLIEGAIAIKLREIAELMRQKEPTGTKVVTAGISRSIDVKRRESLRLIELKSVLLGYPTIKK